jgi:nicotinate phosphoribosyltransferase
VRGVDGAWQHKLKLSEQPIKISNPGVLQVRRLRRGEELIADIIYDSEHGLSEGKHVLWDIDDPTRSIAIAEHEIDHGEDLLTRALDGGRRVRPRDTIETARARAAADLAALSPRTRRFLNPQPHRVGLDPHVHATKRDLIARARENS